MQGRAYCALFWVVHSGQCLPGNASSSVYVGLCSLVSDAEQWILSCVFWVMHTGLIMQAVNTASFKQGTSDLQLQG